jgi:digeranylgeranylglycerophospholipid reductase
MKKYVARDSFDVVVVGGGPAGSTCARLSAEQGLSACLIEEHAAPGHPVQCAGLLSTAAFGECEVSRRAVLHEVSGARIVTGLGSELSFDAGRSRAVVVDRAILDQEMLIAAARAGAEIRVKTAFCGVSGASIQTRGRSGKRDIRFRVLIAADGPRSSIARVLGMKRPRVYLSGLQAELPREMDGRMVELYPDASPDFFGWIIPSGQGRARIGLAGLRDVRSRFEQFLRSAGADSCLHLVSGTLPLGVMPRTYGHRTLFVGDAAGFPKPTSGGGVYTGVRSARHAACVAVEACRLQDASDRVLSGYEKGWKADFGRELDLGFRMFRLRQQITPVEMDRLVQILNDPGVIRDIMEYADMDRPGAIFRRILQNPKVYPVLGILFKKAVANILK